MRFVAIDAKQRRADVVTAGDITTVYRLIDLNPDEVDHGVLIRGGSVELGVGVGFVVGEYSLFVPPAEQFYFAIGMRLFAGNAVLYGFNEIGESADLPKEPPPVMFYRSAREVEAAIGRGEITRPFTAVNGERTWEWKWEEKGA